MKKSEGSNLRGRLLGRHKARVDEYRKEKDISGRAVLEQARRECWHKEKWRLLKWSPHGKESEL